MWKQDAHTQKHKTHKNFKYDDTGEMKRVGVNHLTLEMVLIVNISERLCE